MPKGVHENRTKGVENKVDDTLKLVVFSQEVSRDMLDAVEKCDRFPFSFVL